MPPPGGGNTARAGADAVGLERAQSPQLTPAPCATVHPFPTLYLVSQVASLRPRPNARRQPTAEYRVHRGSGNTVNRRNRTLRHVGFSAPLAIAHRPVHSPAPHRPVRRVSPPLREGRRSVVTAEQPRLTPVISAKAGIQAGPGVGRSARANLGPQFAKTLSGRSADNLNPRTRQPAHRPTLGEKSAFQILPMIY